MCKNIIYKEGIILNIRNAFIKLTFPILFLILSSIMEIISFFILGLGGLYDKYVSTQDLQNFVFDYENDNYKKAFLLSCQNILKKLYYIQFLYESNFYNDVINQQ